MIKLPDLIAGALTRLGAAGLAHPAAKTHADPSFLSVSDVRNVDDMDDLPEGYEKDCIVVWAAKDGTLFPDAIARNLYDNRIAPAGTLDPVADNSGGWRWKLTRQDSIRVPVSDAALRTGYVPKPD